MGSCGAMSKIAEMPGSTLRSDSEPPAAPVSEPIERSQMVQELRTAIDQDELFLCYQPKFQSRTGSIDAVEALVRWRHPINGLVPPGQFIGVAEDVGLIDDLTKWVVERVLADRERLSVAGYDIAVHVNLSARLVPDRDFTQWLIDAAEGLPANALGLEITAAAMTANAKLALRNLRALADAGLMITVDDYGKGAWSLADLKQMPARELKIDRAFIMGLTGNHSDPLLVRATIDLAHALDMQVTAVGVESTTGLALLRMLGCDLIQGFVVSPAIEIVDLGVQHVGRHVQQHRPGGA